ncbi:MAG TPA: hypothetical protein VE871_05170 [Longimicrobium sp.]|nr:hypothetical protein [Longimicrobium sp.]
MAIIRFGDLYNVAVRDGCAATSGCGAAESCRTPEILGTAAAAGEGTASAFFAGEDTGLTERKSAQAQIHVIAIRKIAGDDIGPTARKLAHARHPSDRDP